MSSRGEEPCATDLEIEQKDSTETKYQSPALDQINKLLAKGINSPALKDEDDQADVKTDDEEETKESQPAKQLTEVERQQEILKQGLNRTLTCYCRMKDHTKEHSKDFNDSEVDAITKMTTQLLQQVFPTQLATELQVQNYLIIYYKIYKLKQMESRRNTFLDEFSDVIEIDEDINQFFQSSALTLAKGVRDTAAALDAMVDPSKSSFRLRRR